MTLSYISDADFRQHVKDTIEKYNEKLSGYDLRRLNTNLIDPIKMAFDKAVHGSSWEALIEAEISRQIDKSVNNDIGYFHQRFFKYIENCHVPDNGTEGGWDVIYENPHGVEIPEAGTVHTVYVEMKNKHNTMNSSAAARTYIKMQNQLLQDDDCACFLVETIAKHSQNIPWVTSVNGTQVRHKLIRRVSMDRFYEFVTGEPDAFYRMCLELPGMIKNVVDEVGVAGEGGNSAILELREEAGRYHMGDEDLSMMMALYMLGFSEYNGFR